MIQHSKTKRPSPSAMPDAMRWNAVVARDKACDGRFYYSVASTGIYCRPSCASRLAKRSNVAFYETCAQAEAAGFRPCKRCKPDQPISERQYAEKIAHACRLIETAEAAPKLESLATAVNLSPFHFHRIFKSIVGVTPKAYASAQRNKRVRENLKRTATVTQSIYEAGFNSSGRFYANSALVLGMTPRQSRSGGASTTITFALGDCSLGSILVAATPVGVCAVLLGHNPETLLRDLEDRFPKAELKGGDRAFDKLAARVIAYVEQPDQSIDLPLDVRGTVFQHKVWRALCGIPAGTTVSYAELAKRIGAPNAMRAVAGACAANPVAVVVPCHRVVRGDGALSGYRWGVERKRALLDREAQAGNSKPPLKKSR